MDWILANFVYVPVIMAAASVIVNATPNETDNKILKTMNQVLGVLAANFNVKGVMNK
jgi:hypothetical protein